MKSEKVVFVDESLEKSFNELNELDPLESYLLEQLMHYKMMPFQVET